MSHLFAFNCRRPHILCSLLSLFLLLLNFKISVCTLVLYCTRQDLSLFCIFSFRKHHKFPLPIFLFIPGNPPVWICLVYCGWCLIVFNVFLGSFVVPLSRHHYFRLSVKYQRRCNALIMKNNKDKLKLESINTQHDNAPPQLVITLLHSGCKSWWPIRECTGLMME